MEDKIDLPVLAGAVEIHEGHGPMHLTQSLATSETDEHFIEWVRIIPLGVKVWIKRKSDREAIRTVVFGERILLETLANLGLDSLTPEEEGLRNPVT